MGQIQYNGIMVDIDDAGFLVHSDEWNETVAQALARNEGVGELTKDRIDMLVFMRTYYQEHHFFPIVRAICKQVHLPKDCIVEKFIDPVKAWKIAGLPNPGDEVNMFRTWEPLGF